MSMGPGVREVMILRRRPAELKYELQRTHARRCSCFGAEISGVSGWEGSIQDVMALE
jgi:hypothetical protein